MIASVLVEQDGRVWERKASGWGAFLQEGRWLLLAEGGVPVGIGEGSVISNAIIDKNARIGKNCTITNAAGVEDLVDEENGVYIRSGIVTILRNATIPDGTTI